MIDDFFIVDPGEFEEGFRDGTVLGLDDRYNPGSTAGASLGYLQTDDTVLISTSFEGMKAAMALAGLGSSE